MELKEKVKNFENQEYELRFELLKEIRKEFDKYGKDKVIFHPDESDKDLWEECDVITLDYCTPHIIDNDDWIDTTGRADYIILEDEELKLYCLGRSSYFNWQYISLNNPSWELTLDDLYGLIEIMKDPLIKQINQ